MTSDQDKDKNNPYVKLRKQEDVAEETPPSEPQGNDKSIEDDDGSKARHRKRVAFVLGGILILLTAIVGLYWKYGNTVTIKQTVQEKPTPRVQTQTGNGQQPMIDAVIAQAKKERAQAGGETPTPVQSQEPSEKPAPVPVSDSDMAATAPAPPTQPRLIIPEYSMQTSAGRPGATGVSGGGGGHPATGGGGYSGGQSSRRERGQPRTSKSSVYVVETQASAPVQAPAQAQSIAIPIPGRPGTVPAVVRPATALLEPVRVPEFGALLHVRTLGVVHTLRNGSFARLELTHDMQGKGWALKKGTVFVAQTQGNAMDRAYIGITGFIDPKTNRMVRLTGDLLGGDGALGLKGKRRQISSRWTRAFNRILNIAPGIAQAALARGSSTTVFIQPAGSELIGQNVIGDRREFVEVPAGAPGYILITDLPENIRGLDADPTERLAEQTIASGELSDDELAELFATGNVRDIKAAMPRMNPALRRIAELAVDQKEK